MSKPIEVLAVASRRHRQQFLEFPYWLYREDPYWVPPLLRAAKRMLDTAKHPFYRHAEVQFFLALRGSRVAGRVAAFIDRCAAPPTGLPPGTFGFFECDNDQEAALGLFRAVRLWLASRGAVRLYGPFSPSFLYEYGCLVEGFDDSPYLGTLYNCPYYGALIEGAGLHKAKDFHALRLSVAGLTSPLAQRLRKAAGGMPDLRMRAIRTARTEEEIEVIHDLLHRSWKNNWGFQPIPREELGAFLRELLPLLDLRGVQILEINGRPEAILAVIPDWNQIFKKLGGKLLPFGWLRLLRGMRQITRVRILALGASPELQGSGAVAAFLDALPTGHERLLGEIEASLVLEDNTRALKGLSMLGAVVTKTYRIYEGEV